MVIKLDKIDSKIELKQILSLYKDINLYEIRAQSSLGIHTTLTQSKSGTRPRVQYTLSHLSKSFIS